MTVAELIEALSSLSPDADAYLARDRIFLELAKARSSQTKSSPRLIRYKPRGRLTGTLLWNCPVCGEVNKHRMARLAFKVDCEGCGVVLAIGLSFNFLTTSRKSHVPGDMFLRKGEIDRAPDFEMPVLPEALPLASLGVWSSGDDIHILRRIKGSEVESVRIAEGEDAGSIAKSTRPHWRTLKKLKSKEEK